MIAFEIPGVPVAKGRPKFARRGNFVRAYTPDKTAAAEQTLAARALPFRPKTPITEAICLEAEFVMPIPKGKSQKWRNGAAANAIPHVSRPDLDNLIKLLKDSLNGIFWLDDSQIYSVQATKVYGEFPRTIVRVTEKP